MNAAIRKIEEARRLEDKIRSQTERSKTVAIGGNEYTVWFNTDGMTHLACKGRWPKARVGRGGIGIGDDWLESQLLKVIEND